MTLAIDMAGRRVLVTGAAGGLGGAIAHTLCRVGATVALSDTAGPRLDARAAESRASGALVCTVAANLTADAAGLPARAAEAMGGLDGVVNAAGLLKTTPFSRLPISEWNDLVAVNLTAVFQVIQASCEIMTAGSGGSIVSLASVAARSGRPDGAAYAAAKSGVVSLTKSAAMAYAPSVRVNAICPGVFLTDMWTQIMADRDAEFHPGAGREHLDRIRTMAPLGREGQPEELANVAVFLLSNLASYVTGQAWNVCGGLEMD